MTASFDRTSGLLRVVVKDNGRGMTPEGLAKIFKPFRCSAAALPSPAPAASSRAAACSRTV